MLSEEFPSHCSISQMFPKASFCQGLILPILTCIIT